MNEAYLFNPIGIIHSCFTEKFGIPRQPRLATAARAILDIVPPYDQDEAFTDLKTFSHVWLVFVFHGIEKGKWRPTVRPPRLGGNRRTGVFATRSGFRPNPIGISAVVLEGIDRHNGRLCLTLSGVDLLDQTPVLDIKPYVPYSDRIPEAAGGFATASPQAVLKVEFARAAQRACHRLEHRYPAFMELVTQVLRADPRPAYCKQRKERTDFGIRLYDVNVRWKIRGEKVWVFSVEKIEV
jgi:tRNA-Thr(GGU) m(6)t(6)A37 methyltransferase TsaA